MPLARLIVLLLWCPLLIEAVDTSKSQLLTEDSSTSNDVSLSTEDLAETSTDPISSTNSSQFDLLDLSSSSSNEEIWTTDSIIESTSRRPHFQFMPQFEHSSYDFMVPEGSNPVSTNLAVISYMGQKGTPAPVFKISFDRMRWFEIGNVVRKELDNYVEYKVMINQRADVYVQDSLTKNGSYKFTIEAHDGGTMHTTNIRVDVLALSPKIRRSSTTSTTSVTSTLPPETTKAPLEELQTTTPLLTTTTVSDMSSTGTEAETSTSSSDHVSKETSTTAESDESEEDTTTAESSTEERTSPFVTMESMLTTVTESASSTETLSLSTDSGSEEIIDRALSDLLQTASTEIIERNATSNSKEATTTDTSIEAASVEVSSLENDPSSQVQRKSTRIHLMSESAENRLLNSNSNEDVDDNDEKEEEEVKEVEEKGPSAPVVKEGSGGEPDPISSTESSDEEDEEIEVFVDGVVNGTFQAETLLRDGDLLRGLTVSVKITPKRKNSYTKLSVDRVDAVDIKPKLLYSGSKAYLFVKNSSALNGPLMVKIMAERPNAASIKEIIVMGTPKKQARTEKPRKAVEEYVFSVPEDSLSGTTVGQIKDGESKRVVGPPGLFSLLGSDLILSCPDENGCLDYEKEQMHHVLLVDAQGRKSPPVYVKIKVEDVNDNIPRLEASDSFIRMSNNKLIMPFIVQVLDEDEPLSNKNHLTLSNSAASFLALKEIAPNLYQVDVVGFAPGGHHQLDVTVSDEKSSSSLTIEVEVQNSHSRAHFRRSKYSRSITADKVHHGNQLVQVELEGVPIDEARFVILQGNPGWLSIDDYGGRVGVAKLLSPVESGSYLVEIGAVDRQSNALLAQTQLEIKVVGGAESEKTAFTRNLFKRTLDRETSAVFSVPFKMQKEGLVSVESVLAIDENGQKVDFKKSDVSIERHSVIFKRATLAGLRAVSVGLISEREEATAMLLLTSSAEFIENKKKESARPIFPNPWSRAAQVIELSIPEELPLGHVIYSLPAVNPVDGSLVPLRVSGEMKDFFNVDSLTGTISIARKLDADTMPKDDRTFSLRLSAGSIGYESMAELKVTVVNVDDNTPILEKDGLNNEVPIPENLQPSTMIARLEIRDIDGLGSVDEFSVEKSGIGSELYSASIKNGSLVVSVADNATLDREVMERQTIHLIVRDPAGHQDSVTIHVLLLDENDNPPRFLRDQYEMQVVDNWPTGIVVERLTAVDNDVGKNARVTYSLAPGSTKYFSINPANGELSVSGELAGAARDQPYELTIVAQDSGNPSLSTSIKAKVRINEPLLEKEGEKGQVHFINPPVEFVLKLKEDTPVNEHVYAVKARLAGMTTERANIKYSLRDLSSSLQHFDIDESSGEVYVSKPLDYEQRKFFTLIVSAWNVFDPSKNASRVLRVAIEDVDDTTPVFAKGSTIIFAVPPSNSQSDAIIGRVHASEGGADNPHYYLLPKCTQKVEHFSIHERSGEIKLTAEGQSSTLAREELCIFASSHGNLDVSGVPFDSKNASMIRVAVVPQTAPVPPAPVLPMENNTVTIIQENMRGVSIPVVTPPEAEQKPEFSLKTVNYVPIQNGTEVPTSSTSALFSINSVTGDVIANPLLADQPQGVYRVVLNVAIPNSAQPIPPVVKKFHYVKDEMKLRYVFNLMPEEFSATRDQFLSKLREALEKDHPEGRMEVYLAEPKRDSRNSSRTAVCFHVLMNDQVQNERSAISALSQSTATNSHLSRVYHIFNVVNIERCEAAPIAVRQSSMQLPMQVLLLIAGVALLVLILIALLTYICFVQRYKDHLQMKHKQMKQSEGTPSLASYSPPFILPPVAPHFGYY